MVTRIKNQGDFLDMQVCQKFIQISDKSEIIINGPPNNHRTYEFHTFLSMNSSL